MTSIERARRRARRSCETVVRDGRWIGSVDRARSGCGFWGRVRTQDVSPPAKGWVGAGGDGWWRVEGMREGVVD